MAFIWYLWAITITGAVVYMGITAHHINRAIMAHNEILKTLIEQERS